MAIYPTPIKDGAIDLTPGTPEFVKSFHDTVGNSGTPQDGFDTLLRPADLHLADAPHFLAGLDIGLGALGVSQAALQTDFVADFANHLAATIAQAQPDFNAYDVHLLGNNPPAPTPPPPPTPSSGGQQFVNFGTVVQFDREPERTLTYVNPNDFPVHWTGVKITQGRLLVFVATVECSTTIPARGRCDIVVRARTNLDGDYNGLLVFITDDRGPKLTATLSIVVLPEGTIPSTPPPPGQPPPPPQPTPTPGPEPVPLPGPHPK